MSYLNIGITWANLMKRTFNSRFYGACLSNSFGYCITKKARTVYCFDGDGAVLMHMGGLTTIGSIKPSNYIHVLFNNGAHDSVGGQPTVGFEVDFTKIALACGYKYALVVESASSLNEVLKTVNEMQGPVFWRLR